MDYGPITCELRERFILRLATDGPGETLLWLIGPMAILTHHDRSTCCSLVAYTGRVEALDWLEHAVDSPATESRGFSAALLGAPWPRIAGWLKRGDALELMALDALIAYRAPAPKYIAIRPNSGARFARPADARGVQCSAH